MKDDYLWDGSGEPDPEVGHLERLLSRYRYRPRELRLPDRPQGAHFFRYALAASLVLAALAAGLWLGRPRHDNESRRPLQPTESRGSEPATNDESRRPLQRPTESRGLETAPTPGRESSQQIARRVSARRPDSSGFGGGALNLESLTANPEPLFDPETVRHLERTQMLLRSFKNASFSKNEAADEIAYEKQLARDLLIKNVLLRLDAETERNLPVEELLNTIEPFLLDIANLRDTPSGDEVRSIQRRIQKQEIIAALQVYSAGVFNPTL